MKIQDAPAILRRGRIRRKIDGLEPCFSAVCLLPSLSERLQTALPVLICRMLLRTERPRDRWSFPSLMRPQLRDWCSWDQAASRRTRRRRKRISGRLRYKCGHFPCFMLPSCHSGDSLFYDDAFFLRFYYDGQMSSSSISPYRLYMDSIFLYCILLPAS